MARLTCSSCGRTYNMRGQITTESVLCPECGSSLKPAVESAPKSSTVPARDSDIMDALHKAAAFEDGVTSKNAYDDGDSIPIDDPEPSAAPKSTAKPASPAKDGDLISALYEAADFEDKVPTPKTSAMPGTGVVPGTGAVSGTGAMPGTTGTTRIGTRGTRPTTRGLPADRESTRPLAGEIGVDWDAAGPISRKPPNDDDFVEPPWRPSKKQILIGVSVILGLLMLTTILAMSLGGESSKPDPRSNVGTNIATNAPPAPPKAVEFWSPEKPAELQRVSGILAGLPAITVGVKVTGPALDANAYSLSIMDRHFDYSGLRIEDSHGQRQTVDQIPAAMTELLKGKLLEKLSEQGFTPELKDVFEQATLRVTYELTPVWSSPKPSSFNEQFARHSTLPCGVDVVVADVTLAGKTDSIQLLGEGGINVLSPRKFQSSRSASLTGGAPEVGEPEETGARVNGLARYADLDLLDPARSAAIWTGSLICQPDRDWQSLWEPNAAQVEPAKAVPGIAAIAGMGLFAEVAKSHPERITPEIAEALTAIIADKSTPNEWLRPFLDSKPEFAKAALTELAKRRDDYAVSEMQECLANTQNYSPETIRACACAMLDMGQDSSELTSVIEQGLVDGFPEVCNAEHLVALDGSVKPRILKWMLDSGCPRQKLTAAAIALIEDRQDLKLLADETLASSTAAPAEAFSDAFGLLWAKGYQDINVYKVAVEYLSVSNIGDVAIVVPATAPKPEHAGVVRLSDVVAASLIRTADKKSAPELLKMLDSPSPFTQMSAMRALGKIDYVDAAILLHERDKALNELLVKNKILDPIDAAVLETLRPIAKDLRRYENIMTTIDMMILQGTSSSLENAKNNIKKIMDEQPGTKVAERAQAKLVAVKAKTAALAPKPAETPVP